MHDPADRLLFLRHALVALMLCGVLFGCGKQEPARQSPLANPDEPETQPATAQQDANVTGVEDLRALPYAGSYETDEDETGGMVFRDPRRSCPGYNLYTVQEHSRAELIDGDGTVIRVWSHQPSQTWERAALLPSGDLIVVGAEESAWPNGQPTPHSIADDARYVLRFNWAGELLWKKKLTAHHDVELAPDGKLLVLTFKRRHVPQIHPQINVRDDQLTLLELTDGSPTTSYSMLDAVGRSRGVFRLGRLGPSTLGGPPWIDLFHSNSAEWMHHAHLVDKHTLYDLNNILVCFRHQDRIAVFNWPGNKVVWAWGHGEIDGPHDAQVLENGNILLFDNGLRRRWSRAIELDPLTGQIVWEYKADPLRSFYSASKGSAQRLPNGNTLLAESDKGRAIEVTPTGEIVWEFICPHKVGKGRRAVIVRMKRFPLEFVDELIKQADH